MSLVAAVRRLRRRPRLMIVALVCACVVAVAIPYQLPSMKSRQHQVGIASASALVDSARSQIADLGDSTGTDVGTLAYRASLFASLITSSPLKDQIARNAGIALDSLIATGPTPVPASNSPAPAVSGASVSSSSPNASTLTASVPTLTAGQIPVIQVNTQAPTPAIAAKLANAAFSTLQAEVGTVAGTDNIPALQRVVIRPLGPAAATLATRGPGLLFGIIGALLAFLLVCAAGLGLSSLRAALAREPMEPIEPMDFLGSGLDFPGSGLDFPGPGVLDADQPGAYGLLPHGGPGLPHGLTRGPDPDDPSGEDSDSDPAGDMPRDPMDDVPVSMQTGEPSTKPIFGRVSRPLPRRRRESSDRDSAVTRT